MFFFKNLSLVVIIKIKNAGTFRGLNKESILSESTLEIQTEFKYTTHWDYIILNGKYILIIIAPFMQFYVKYIDDCYSAVSYNCIFYQ